LVNIIDTSNEPNIINQILDNQKKQHMAQETLEETNWKVLGTKKDTFYDGAKWQQEKMLEIMDAYAHDVMSGCTLNAKEWLKQTYKKHTT
jgi:hypothetical protein